MTSGAADDSRLPATRHPQDRCNSKLAAAPSPIHLHFTPTHSSWINQVERWFGELTDKQIRRGTHRSSRALEDAIPLYVKLNKEAPRPYLWVKTADQILASIQRFC